MTQILIAFLALVNAATLALCLYDRTAAIRFWWRVPEPWILALSFAGGLPAAKLVQIASGHKRLRRQFTLNLNLIAAFQLMFGLAAWSAITPLAKSLPVTEVTDTALEEVEEVPPKRFGPGS